MEKLTRTLMARQDRRYAQKPDIQVVQFGEGNFLRGFADPMFDSLSSLGIQMDVAVVQPIVKGLTAMLNAQDGLYTLMLRGMQNGQPVERARVVGCIRQALSPYERFEDFLALARLPKLRVVISNTTEAGIATHPDDRLDGAPPHSFPGKLARLLWERFNAFNGARDKGLILLPCELIDDNGAALRRCVLQTARAWALPEAFAAWVENHNFFANTLVDRIVTGYPREEAPALWEKLGYRDDLLNTAEPFGLWVIEAPQWVAQALPFDKAGQPVIFTGDARPYKLRKVRMLNGAHTAMVPAAYLAGKNIVRDCMQDPVLRSFMDELLHQEIMPTIPLPQDELQAFAASLFERFSNPYIDHQLLSITLNSISKYKARVLPTLLSYGGRGAWPRRLAFSFAALIAFYHGQWQDGRFVGKRGEQVYEIQDDAATLQFFGEIAALPAAQRAQRVLAHTSFWAEDLCLRPGLLAAVQTELEPIQRLGMAQALKNLQEGQHDQ